MATIVPLPEMKTAYGSPVNPYSEVVTWASPSEPTGKVTPLEAAKEAACEGESMLSTPTTESSFKGPEPDCCLRTALASGGNSL